MNFDTSNLPDNVEDLKKLVGSLQSELEESEDRYQQVSKEKDQLNKEYAELESKKDKKINILHEQLRLLRLQLFGKRSEKLNFPEMFKQLSLFDGIEEDYASEEEPEAECEPETTEVKSHTRKRSGRQPLPEDLPREEVIHDIPESEKVCGCGCQLERIGEETSEKLEIEQPRIYVKRHIRYKYACKNCEGTESDKAVKVAPVPPQILPKSIASESLLAHIITGKFADALPFYRQEKQFLRNNIKISRSTMSIWALKLFERCYPLENLLFQATHSGPLIQMDETTVQVLNEEGRDPSSKSYMWVMRGGPPEKPTVYFRYYPTRRGFAAEELLTGYEGYVQSDAYTGYDFLDKKDKNGKELEEWEKITHVGCWAHVRRKFFDVKKAAKSKKPGKADKALKLIGKLYKVEKKAQNQKLSADEILELRQKESKPLVDEIKTLLDDNIAKIPTETTLGKAFKYAVNQWKRLNVFLKDGNIPIDNNRVENDIRPFVVGRKNWLFTKSTAGAKASAFFYSLVETAKNNNLEPFAYLRYIFEKIPLATNKEDYKALLPQNIDRDLLK